MKEENIALKELAKENGHEEADAKTDDPKGTHHSPPPKKEEVVRSLCNDSSVFICPGNPFTSFRPSVLLPSFFSLCMTYIQPDSLHFLFSSSAPKLLVYFISSPIS